MKLFAQPTKRPTQIVMPMQDNDMDDVILFWSRYFESSGEGAEAPEGRRERRREEGKGERE